MRSLAIVMTLLLVASLAAARPALAMPVTAPNAGDPNCPHGGNWISAACFYGPTHVSTYAEWTNVSMFASSTYVAEGGHINNTLFAYRGSPCNNWVEVGLSQGWNGSNVYTYYYGYDTLTSGGPVAIRDFTPATVGAHNWYRLDYIGPVPGNSSGQYNIWRQDSMLNSAPVDGLGFGTCISSVGLEIQKDLFGTPPGTETSSDTVINSPLTWKDTSGLWHTGWVNTMYWVDYPCDGTNPSCLNGIYQNGNSADWRCNKVRF